MVANASALWLTSVPARDAEDVPPDKAMGKMTIPTPSLAQAITTSQALFPRVKGLMGQTLTENIGRFSKTSRPPTLADAISTMASRD